MNDFDEHISVISVGKKYSLDFSKNPYEVIDRDTGIRMPYDTDSKILIYEDRQRTWFFDIGEDLKTNNEAGFVILMIAVSYLEGNQQFRQGRASTSATSTSFIKTAMERIFPELDADCIDLFVRQVRQGFFHDGITRKLVLIVVNKEVPALAQVKNKLWINPHLFLDRVKQDFENYIGELKSSQNNPLRTAFEQWWTQFKGF